MWGEFDTEFIFQLFSPLSGFSQLLKCVIHWKGAHPCRKMAEKGKGKSTFSLMHKLPLWGETTFHSLMKRETGEHYLLFFLPSLSWGRSFPWFVIKKPLGFATQPCRCAHIAPGIFWYLVTHCCLLIPAWVHGARDWIDAERQVALAAHRLCYLETAASGLVLGPYLNQVFTFS